jgi:peroxiredoxin
MQTYILITGLALAWTAILAGAWLGWHLLQQNGRILVRLNELGSRLDTLEFGEDDQPPALAVGAEAPQFELPDLAGERKSLAHYRGQPVLLIFFNPGCGFCRDLLPMLSSICRSRSEDLKIKNAELSISASKTDQSLVSLAPALLFISAGDVQANGALFSGHQIDYSVLLQDESEVAAAYRADGTPSGYLISAEGTIASDLAMGAEALLKLYSEGGGGRGDTARTGESENLNSKSQIDQSLVTSVATGNGSDRSARFGSRSLARSKIKRDGLPTGAAAPDFRLPLLDGRGELTLGELRGHKFILVFSSPHCEPCNELAPYLEKFHQDQEGVKVVMISRGHRADNKAKVKEHKLTFPIVLQQQWEISRRYAMFATPIGYLIDEAGVIAQEVAVGVVAILNLMGQATSIETTREMR